MSSARSIPTTCWSQRPPAAACAASRTTSPCTAAYQIAAAGLNDCDTAVLNHDLRRTLHNRGGYVTPLELVARRLAEYG
jgi:hypothetical protein